MSVAQTWIPEAVRFGVDAVSGAEVEQLTAEPVTSTNIYCEQRYTSADGGRIAMSRRAFGRPSELWVCDLRTLRICHVTPGIPVAANAPLNALYYLSSAEPDARLMRLDMEEFTTREMFRFGDVPAVRGISVSPDEQCFVGGPMPVRDNVFGLIRVDLDSGRSRLLCEIEDMINPHVQFEPTSGRHLMVQVNRGGRRRLPGGKPQMTGAMGATLCLVDPESGVVEAVPAGRPHTPPISGHECWVGGTGRMIFTAGQYHVTLSAYVTLGPPPDAEREMPPAAIYSVAPGEPAARVLATGSLFNHLAASDDGHFFIADDHTTGVIHVGSIATGRHLPLCHSHTRQGTSQAGHVHAYMTPDNRHVIFNSNVTGVTQVYAARVPDGFLSEVLGA